MEIELVFMAIKRSINEWNDPAMLNKLVEELTMLAGLAAAKAEEMSK